MDWLADNVIPILLFVGLPLAALGLRAGAKAVRRFTRKTETKLDDQPGEAVADALEGAADAIGKKDDK